MKNTNLSIVSPDQTELRGREWIPDKTPRAALCLIHGLGEHGDRYDHVAEALNREGIAVVSFDQRGHGTSDGKRGVVTCYAQLMDDVGLQLSTTKQKYPDLPVFLYGHSLGGNMVLCYTLRHLPALAGAIASAPMIRAANPPPEWQLHLLRPSHAMKLPVAIPNGIDANNLSHDVSVVQSYKDDPLTHDLISPTLALEMIENGKWILEQATRTAALCPLLLMHGDADRVTSHKATEELAAILPDSTLKIWPGLYHEPHNEPNKEDVLAFVARWIQQQISLLQTNS